MITNSESNAATYVYIVDHCYLQPGGTFTPWGDGGKYRASSCTASSFIIQPPTGQPTSQPSSQPTGQPSSEPTNPTSQPSGQPSSQPSSRPSGQPTGAPSQIGCIQFATEWIPYSSWVSYSGSRGWCRALPSMAYHHCSSDSLQMCSVSRFWGDSVTGGCEVAMCPPGFVTGPVGTGFGYSNPQAWSQNPECPCTLRV